MMIKEKMVIRTSESLIVPIWIVLKVPRTAAGNDSMLRKILRIPEKMLNGFGNWKVPKSVICWGLVRERIPASS